MPSAAPAAAPEAPGPVDARALIEKALARNPAERFQDARSLLTTIRALDPSANSQREVNPATGSDPP